MSSSLWLSGKTQHFLNSTSHTCQKTWIPSKSTQWCNICVHNYSSGFTPLSYSHTVLILLLSFNALPTNLVIWWQEVTYRQSGAGSDSGHKLLLFAGGFSLRLLKAVQSSGEVVQQALFLYLSLTLKETQKYCNQMNKWTCQSYGLYLISLVWYHRFYRKDWLQCSLVSGLLFWAFRCCHAFFGTTSNHFEWKAEALWCHI